MLLNSRTKDLFLRLSHTTKGQKKVEEGGNTPSVRSGSLFPCSCSIGFAKGLNSRTGGTLQVYPNFYRMRFCFIDLPCCSAAAAAASAPNSAGNRNSNVHLYGARNGTSFMGWLYFHFN